MNATALQPFAEAACLHCTDLDHISARLQLQYQNYLCKKAQTGKGVQVQDLAAQQLTEAVQHWQHVHSMILIMLHALGQKSLCQHTLQCPISNTSMKVYTWAGLLVAQGRPA